MIEFFWLLISDLQLKSTHTDYFAGRRENTPRIKTEASLLD